MKHNNKPEFVNGIKVPYDLSEHELITLLHNPEKKWAAFTALGYINSEWSLLLLKQFTDSKDLFEHVAAIKALANHVLGSTIPDILQRDLNHHEPLIVTNACAAISKLGLIKLHDAVANLLESPNIDIKISAIRAIDILWEESDLSKLIHIFKTYNDDSHNEAAWVLRNHANTSNWFDLFYIFAKEKHPPRHRVWACEIAFEFGDESALSLLTNLLMDADGHVRKHATSTYEKISNKSE